MARHERTKRSSRRTARPSGVCSARPMVSVSQTGDGRLELCDSHIRLRLARVPSVLIGLGMLSISPAFAADTVVGVSPSNASHSARLNTDVSATLSNDVTAVTAQTFLLHPSQTARTSANGASSSNTTATINPSSDFHPGELVQATVTSGVTTSAGGVTPFAWQFRTGVTPSSGDFVQAGITLGTLVSNSVALGDVDGDGDLDLFVAMWNAANRVWINDGSGSFTPSANSLGTSLSWDVALGDLDLDGDLDAFVANYGDQDQVWINDGSGTFSNSVQTTYSYPTSAVALGDVDGDGDLDAWVAIGGYDYDTEDTLYINQWVETGSLNFTIFPQNFGSHFGYEVALGDVDGDGDLDAWVANWGYDDQVWLNDLNGTGEFVEGPNGAGLGPSYSSDVALGDVDGDGDLDAFVTNYGVYGGVGEANRVWLNDGSGTFTLSSNSLGDGHSESVALGDVDGDGDLDAIVVNDYNESNLLWLNDGRGTFTDSGQSLGGSNTLGAALGDVDGDGDLDVEIVDDIGITGHVKSWFNQNCPSLICPGGMSSGWRVILKEPAP